MAVKFQMEATQFKTEAEQLAKISHENIITVYGHSIQNDNYVIVMEFAKGGALAACKYWVKYLMTDHNLMLIYLSIFSAQWSQLPVNQL